MNNSSSAAGTRRVDKPSQQQQAQQKENHDGGISPVDQQAKGLRMKIKRKSSGAPANQGPVKDTLSKHDNQHGKTPVTSSSTAEATKAKHLSTANERADSNNSVGSSSSHSAGGGMTSAKPSKSEPFERLRQAILEQEKNKQQSKQMKAAAAAAAVAGSCCC